MIKLGVLCSGRGTDLQSIIDATASGYLAAEISIVLTDKPNVGALARAEAAGIKPMAAARIIETTLFAFIVFPFLPLLGTLRSFKMGIAICFSYKYSRSK